MNDRRRSANADGEEGLAYEGGSGVGVPRWVKLTVIILALVALVVAVVLLTGGGGEHGPARHGPGGPGGPMPTAPAHDGPPPGLHD